MRRLFLFLSITLGCAAVSAQPANLQRGDSQELAALRPGVQIRVSLRGGGSYQGTLQDVNDGTLRITQGRIVTLEDVQRVWVKQPSHRGRHALIGAAIGAGAGLGIGAAVDNDCSKNSIICTGDRGKAIGVPLFAVLGAGIGAALPAHGWREVYTMKRQSDSSLRHF